MTLVRHHSRNGFTLVELMVVIAIIGILAILTAGAALQVMGAQRTNGTGVTIQKVDKILQQHWQAVAAQARSEAIPAEYLNAHVDPATGAPLWWGLLYMAGYDPDNVQANGSPGVAPLYEQRARVIWIKLRLKQQFPTFFDEAKNPTPPTITGPIGGAFFPPGSPGPKVMLPFIRIPAAPVFTSLPASASPPGIAESTACLLVSLAQARRGEGLKDDSLAPGETGDVPGASGRKCLLDAWGQPMAFYRFPGAWPGSELDQSVCPAGAPGSSTATQNRFRDPLDPTGLLLHPDWNNPMNHVAHRGVWAFEQLLHLVHDPNVPPTPYPPTPPAKWERSYYTLPTLASAGKNNVLGLVSARTAPLWASDMSPDPATAGAADDNVYNYRFRLGGRGD